jgi:chromosomal replication initiation ATPase DnaA
MGLDILQVVCEAGEMTQEEITGASRKPSIFRARAVAIFLANTYAGMSSKELKGIFMRDHSTILHSVKVGRSILEDEPELKDTIMQSVREKIGKPLGKDAFA